MWLFFVQYKKMISICVIPIIAVVTLIGFEVFHGKENRSEPLAVNAGMNALLEENRKPSSTPLPAEAKPTKAVTDSPEPDILNTIEEVEVSTPTQNSEVKPKHTAKPKATPKSKAASKSKGTQNLNLKVNINKASTEELVKLKGIGESKAKAIIAYRTVHSFQTIEDLMKVKGIGPKIFANIKEQLEL